MMTVAEVRRDTRGKLLPLQSYDEMIRRGMSFLLDDHLKWFKGPEETITDENGHVQMPWVYYSNVQHNGAPFPDSIDRFVSYPAFHHSLLIRTFIRYSEYSGDGRALVEAVKLADWNIAHSTPGDWAYRSLPYSTFQEKKPGGFRDKTGLMPDKAAIMALTYVDLYRATHNPRFLKAAQAIAQTLADRQRPNGTWPFRVDPKTEKVIEEYTSSVIYAVQLFESLDKINGNHRFRAKRDLTWHWLLNGPIKTKEFRGFYEDIVPSPKGRTNYDCLDTIRYLLAKRTEENGYLEIAKDLNTWVEKIFLDRIKGFEPAEGIREQLQCNVVMGIHSLNWASMLYDLAEATGDEKMRKRAIQTANYITYYLQPDNRIVVGFQYHQWWYSCHTGVILYLLDFVDENLAAAKPFFLGNKYVSVEIDRNTGALRSIRDKKLDVVYAQAGMGFEVVTTEGTLRSEKASALSATAGQAALRFAGNGLDVTLRYQLGANDHFIEKWLEIRSSDGKPYFLKSVFLEDMSTEAYSEIHFHDDQTIWHCPINLFLRGEKGGCFAGLEYPYWDLKQNGKEGFRLGYQPNYQVTKGEVNISEKYFIGVYRKEGIYRISQGPYPGRGRSPLVKFSAGLKQHFKGPIPNPIKDVPLETLDWGEVWAMKAFMRHVLPNDLALPEEGYWVWQNGWWAGLWDVKPSILDYLKEAGIHDVMTAHTWYGRGVHPLSPPYIHKMRTDPMAFPKDTGIAGMPGPGAITKGLDHADQSKAKVFLDNFKKDEYTPEFVLPKAMEKFHQYGKKIGVHVNSFSIASVYFKDHPEWAAIDENGKVCEYLFGRKASCFACDEYADHMFKITDHVFKKYQPRWWGWDGRWLSFWEVGHYRPGPKGAGPDPCYAKNHGHLPGDNRYKEWKNILAFLKKIKERYPKVCLESYYGLHRGGPWGLRNLDSAYHYYETHGADMNRLQSWHQQNDRFRPVYKNSLDLFGKDPKSFRFNLIAGLSIASYCMIGEAYPQFAAKENRDFFMKWRAWATKNLDYLLVKRDLFGCPGDSAVDGSAHIIKDRGFLFLFRGGFDKKVNQNTAVRASIPMNRWIQLEEDPEAIYQIKEIYPREGKVLATVRYGETFLYDMPKDYAVILALEPAPKGSKTFQSIAGDQEKQVQVIPAFTSIKSQDTRIK